MDNQRFISEKDAEEARKRIQDEWARVRKPEDPEEAPVEYKSLFERLEEARYKKQAEYDEQHNLKNLVKGLDQEECEFLDQVKEIQGLEEKKKKEEEKAILSELYEARNRKLDEDGPSHLKIAVKSSDSERNVKRISKQAELIRGAIKRKKSSESEYEVKEGPVAAMYPTKMVRPTARQVIGIRPGMVDYTSSSQSDSDASSDQSIDLPVNPVLILKKGEKSKKVSGGADSEAS